MNLGRQAYSSSLLSLRYPDPVMLNHFTSFHFTPLRFQFTSLHVTFVALLHFPDFYFPNPLPKCMRFNGASPFRPFR
jgi:hypothetical protein